MQKGNATLIIIGLGIGIITGFLLAQEEPWANAQTQTEIHANVAASMSVDRVSLEQIYRGVFSRPLDDGAEFHVGKNLRTVLTDLNNSPERRYYAAVYMSIKAYEDALRAPGTLSEAEKRQYLQTIDVALSTLAAWAESLPEKQICLGVVRPEHARQAIIDNYTNLAVSGRATAEMGLFASANQIGHPTNLPLPPGRCITVSPTPTMTPTPSPTLSPTPTPSPTPTASPTP